MRIFDLMTKNPHIIHGNTTLVEVAKKMEELKCGIFPIGDPDHLPHVHIIGIVTDRDIVIRAVAKNMDINKTLVKDIMTKNMVFCEEADFLQSAIHQMNKHNIRRVLVKNKNKQLSGILSLGDIIRRTSDKTMLTTLLKETVVA